MAILKYYKLNPNVPSPKFQTAQSACFDLCFSKMGKGDYKGWNAANKEFVRSLFPTGNITIMPGDRVLVPTGLIFDIPEGYSLRVFSRSSVALKRGLMLVNAVGVIDSDYVDETFLLMTNLSVNPQVIEDNERLCQAELIKLDPPSAFEETTERPTQKTDRVGGLGSTGTKAETTTAPTANAKVVMVQARKWKDRRKGPLITHNKDGSPRQKPGPKPRMIEVIVENN